MVYTWGGKSVRCPQLRGVIIERGSTVISGATHYHYTCIVDKNIGASAIFGVYELKHVRDLCGVAEVGAMVMKLLINTSCEFDLREGDY